MDLPSEHDMLDESCAESPFRMIPMIELRWVLSQQYHPVTRDPYADFFFDIT
jgi:hypothetical protein